MAKEPADVIEVGRLFHKRVPVTAKDRSPAAIFDRSTNRRPLRLSAGVGWQLQTMVARCSVQGNQLLCRKRTYTS